MSRLSVPHPVGLTLRAKTGRVTEDDDVAFLARSVAQNKTRLPVPHSKVSGNHLSLDVVGVNKRSRGWQFTVTAKDLQTSNGTCMAPTADAAFGGHIGQKPVKVTNETKFRLADEFQFKFVAVKLSMDCLLYTSPSPRDRG